MRLQLALLLVALATTALASVKLEEYGTEEERQVAIQEAIAEAKATSKARLEKASVQSEAQKQGKYTAAQLLSKFFKRASTEAKKNGEARLLYEQMIHKSERKLSEIRRSHLAATQSSQDKAEAIAHELFHTPGSLLTKQEIAHMWQESGCEELREKPDCRFLTVNQFRTIDGTCNNRRKPLLGAAGTIFKRLAPPEYEDGISSLRGTLQNRGGFFDDLTPFVPPNPSPRFISSTIVQNITNDELPFSHLLMQWGQFLDHDLDLSPELESECEGCEATEICEPIRVPDIDRAFGKGTRNDGECLPLRRSLPACEIEKPLSFFPREQTNDITSFIDASMVYGSRDSVANSVRAFEDGLLRVGKAFPGTQPSLPVDEDEIVACMNNMECFLCGDVRCNEQISLTVIHTYWLREHNRCAKEMATINPHWDDERLYQECRKIVGALVQKITFEDYLPKVFGVPAFNDFVGPYPGYLPTVDPSVPNSFATAAYRYGHSLIRSKFDRLDVNYRPVAIGPLKLVDMFFNPEQFKISQGTDYIARGWLNANSRRMDEFLNIVLTTQLFQTPISSGMDLASLNIQRGRDHGLPPYTTFRNLCAREFGQASPFENDLTLVRFLQLYGTLDTLDLWVGGLAEDRLPDSLLGATFACIFGLTFQAVRNGDRFWYERNAVFSRAQRREIKKDSLSRVLCDNSDEMVTIQPDAFLTNQPRVPCSSLPRIDLSLWKEDVCYFRVALEDASSDETIEVISRSARPTFVFTSAIIPRPRNERSFECVQVQCPTDRRDTDIVVMASPQMPYKVDPSLPASSLPPEDKAYSASWPRSQFTAGQGGVFFSEDACRGSNQVALTFSGAKATGQSDEKIPDSVQEILDSEIPDTDSDGKEQDKAAKTASDSELLKELENALEQLE